MTYRFAALARRQTAAVLRKSVRLHGTDAAKRYGALIIIAMEAAGKDPALIGSAPVPPFANIRAYPIRFSRTKVEKYQRVHSPRHIIVYRVVDDGIEIICLVHDKMLLRRAAQRAIRDIDRTT